MYHPSQIPDTLVPVGTVKLLEKTLKSTIVLLLLVWTCLASAPDVPVYPGAVVDEAVSKDLRKDHPDGIGYNTADSFDKVEAFYKKAGGEDAPYTRNVSATMKYVVIRFPGKKFLAQLSWVGADTKHGTVIQLFQK